MMTIQPASGDALPQRQPLELEIIACSLDDALAAEEGGATRLEVTVQLDQDGLTPPLELVKQIARRVRLPVRLMLRERNDFALSGREELARLQQHVREFAVHQVEGFVVGHIKEGRLDFEALAQVMAAAPATRFTVHHAIEMSADPAASLAALRAFPNVDRALVSGGSGPLAERVERLVAYERAFGPGRSLILGGGLKLDMLAPLRRGTHIRVFHLGRAVRTPETALGQVDPRKVKMARDLLLAEG